MGVYAAGGRFDLILSFRFDPDPQTLQRWKDSFQKASELLQVATDGQHRLGTMWYCPKSTGGMNADFWVYDSTGRSSANARIWEPFLHGQLYRQVQDRPFTIVHELGHYLYSLGDEYKAPDAPDGSEVWATCLGIDYDDRATACVMEASWAQGDRWEDEWGVRVWKEGSVHEFCTESNHDQSASSADWFDGVADNTVQSVRHGEACWDTMAKFYPDLAVPAMPSDVRPTSYPAIEWKRLESTKRYVFIADISSVDPSREASLIHKLESILFGFRRTAPSHEFFGVVLTTQDHTYVGDLTHVPPHHMWPGRWSALLAMLTKKPRLDLGRMLGAAQRMIRNAGDQAATQVVTLFAFGPVALGPDPFDAAEQLRDEGTRLYTFSTVPALQRRKLKALATVTGGTYAEFALHGVGGLPALRSRLADLYDLAHEEGGLVTVDAAIVDTSNASIPGSSGGGDTGLEDGEDSTSPSLANEFITWIEPGCRRAVFTLEWTIRAPLEFALVAPGGRVFRMSREDHEHRAPGDTCRVIEVDQPEEGEWRGRVLVLPRRRQRTRPKVEVLHRVFVEGSGLQFALTTPQPVYAPGETIRVIGQVTADRILSDVRMHGEVTDPLGRVSEVELVEDTEVRLGRRALCSGCHCVRFTPEIEGPHVFHIVADNPDERAKIADGGDVTGEEPGKAKPIGPFVRHASITVLVGDPPVPSARAHPRRLERGERHEVTIRFTKIPWVPGVSRLWFGDDIRVEEDLEAAAEGGDPVFRIDVDGCAATRRHGAVVLTGGTRYWLPRLIRVTQ